MVGGAPVRGGERLDPRVGLHRRVRDAFVGGLDEELDELRDNLAASEGVTAALQEVREVLHLEVDGLDVSEVAERINEAVERTGIDG